MLMRSGDARGDGEPDPGISELLIASWLDGRPVVSGAAPGAPAVHFPSQKRASQKP
jgi:hypothetical protein